MTNSSVKEDYFTYTAPVSHWRCYFENEQLARITLHDPESTAISASASYHLDYAKALDDFFNSHGKLLIAIPTRLSGTAFSQKVWHYLRTIPASETRTYKDASIDLSTSPRAVGNACRNNPFPLLFPCHRIVAKDGLGGYMGLHPHTLAIKQALLDREKEKPFAAH